MHQRKLFALAAAASAGAALIGLPAQAHNHHHHSINWIGNDLNNQAGQIDWSQVPGTQGPNDASRDLVSSPDTLNSQLSNDYTAWQTKQFSVDQANTQTGREQRMAAIGQVGKNLRAQNTSYSDETVVISQSAPDYYSEGSQDRDADDSIGSPARSNQKSLSGNAADNGSADRATGAGSSVSSSMVQNPGPSHSNQARNRRHQRHHVNDSQMSDQESTQDQHSMDQSSMNDVSTTQSKVSQRSSETRNNVASNDQDNSATKMQGSAESNMRESSAMQDNTAMQGSAAAHKKLGKADYQAHLAPHALILQSSLRSAIDQVRGMKGELNLSQKEGNQKLSNDAMNAYRTFIREIRNDMKVAQAHERQLHTSAMRYPELAQSQGLRDLTPAFQDANQAVNSIGSKLNNRSFWNDQQAATSSLDQLEKRLSNALSKTESFASDKLGSSIG